MEPIELIIYLILVWVLLYIYSLLFNDMPQRNPCRILPSHQVQSCIPNPAIRRNRPVHQLAVKANAGITCVECVDTSMHDIRPSAFMNQERYDRKTYVNCREFTKAKLPEKSLHVST